MAEKEGLSLSLLHFEATRREYLTTPEETDWIEAELGYPKFDPHGDPITTAQGELPVSATEEERQLGISFSQWSEHCIGRIVHMEDEPPALFNQVTLLGLTPGDLPAPGRACVRLPAE